MYVMSVITDVGHYTSGIPLLLKSQRYHDEFYLDGASKDAFPLQYVHNVVKCKHILGIVSHNQGDLNFANSPTEDTIKTPTIISYIQQLMNVALQSEDVSFTSSSHIVSIKCSQMSWESIHFNIENKHKFNLFSMGFQQAKSTLSKHIKEKTD